MNENKKRNTQATEVLATKINKNGLRSCLGLRCKKYKQKDKFD